MQTVLSITQNYQHVSYLVLPLLAAIRGMVVLKSVQVYRPELAYIREAFVVRSAGRSVWRRFYDSWLF
jgi:hypothetical protein